MSLKMLRDKQILILIAYFLVIPIYEIYRNYTKEVFSIQLLISYVTTIGMSVLTFQNARLAQNFEITKELIDFMRQSYENSSKDRLKELKNYERKTSELRTRIEILETLKK